MLAKFLPMFFTIFIVIDPIGIVPLFITATSHLDAAGRRATIRKAIFVSFAIMAVFIVGGRFILSFFGISPGAFYVAGGTLFFLISIDMLFGQRKRSKTSMEEEEEDPASVAVFPLAIPMISGPGTVTTLMIYAAGPGEWWQLVAMLLTAITLTLAVVYLAMRASGFLLRALGKTGVSVVERMMGLILSGLAVQFVYEGLVRLGVLAGA